MLGTDVAPLLLQVDKSDEPFSWAAPDVDGLRALCQRVLGWDRAQSDGLLMPMVKVNENVYRNLSLSMRMHRRALQQREVRLECMWRLRSVSWQIGKGTS